MTKGRLYVKCPFLSTRGGWGDQNWVKFGPRRVGFIVTLFMDGTLKIESQEARKLHIISVVVGGKKLH